MNKNNQAQGRKTGS